MLGVDLGEYEEIMLNLQLDSKALLVFLGGGSIGGAIRWNFKMAGSATVESGQEDTFQVSILLCRYGDQRLGSGKSSWLM